MTEPRIEPLLTPPTASAGAPDPVLEPELGAAPVLMAEPRRVQRPRRSLLNWVAWGLLFLILLPPGVVLALRWVPPPVTAFMLQSETQPVRYQWVPSSQIAEVARRAVVAAEDQKFWAHEGFDFEAIEKALANNQKKDRRIRGASTISQQTAKNLFLWPGGGYFRKAVEASFTVLIEKLWGKERILEVYLNVAEFGPGIYGVEAASRAHFQKSAANLTPEEAARLAAVLPSPRRWSARNPGPYVQKRATWVLRQMGYGRAPVPEPMPEPEFEPGVLPADPDSEVPSSADEDPSGWIEPDEPVEPELPAMEAWPTKAEPAVQP